MGKVYFKITVVLLTMIQVGNTIPVPKSYQGLNNLGEETVVAGGNVGIPRSLVADRGIRHILGFSTIRVRFHNIRDSFVSGEESSGEVLSNFENEGPGTEIKGDGVKESLELLPAINVKHRTEKNSFILSRGHIRRLLL